MYEFKDDDTYMGFNTDDTYMGFNTDNTHERFDDDYTESLKIETNTDKFISLGVLSLISLYVFLLCVYYYKRKYNLNNTSNISTPTITNSQNDNLNISRYGDIIMLDEHNIIHYFDKECSICFCEYIEHDKIIKLFNCSHVFHCECIIQWFTQAIRCPFCNNINLIIHVE